jgi:carboxypeptidase A2
MRAVVAVLFLVSAVLAQDRFLYNGYKVYDLYPTEIDDIHFLHQLMLEDPNLDFWEEPSKIGGKVTVMVPPEHQSKFMGALMGHDDIHMTVRHEDLAEFMTEFWNDLDQRQSQKNPETRLNFDDFNTLADIEAYLAELPAGDCATAGLSCTLNDIGDTVNSRDIWSIRVATSATTNKPSFWLDSTIHAREWLAPATTLKILNHLITNYGTDSTVTYLLDNYDWFFVPVFNPDGYDYTWTNQRLWRKNRNTFGSCVGVDLNRNHAWNWGRQGVSHDPCSDTYCGPSAASELEVQAVQDEIIRVNALSGIEVMMTFHSYGNMWMHPWGNTLDFSSSTPCERADDHDDMYALAVATANAIQSTYNTNWSRGTSCEVIYATTGGTDDWAKGVVGIKHCICPELRGSNFIINPDQIDLSFNEIWNGLVAQEAALP